MKKLIVIILAAFMFVGCSKEINDKSTDTSSNNSVSVSADNSVSSNNKQKNEVSADKVEILKEYIYNNEGWSSYHFIIIKNNNDTTVHVETNTLAYDSKNNVVDAASGYLEALGPGCTSIIQEYFDDTTVDHVETTYQIKEEASYYDSVIQNLSMNLNAAKDKVIVTVTNNGDIPAQFVEAYALFFDEAGKIVGSNWTYIVDDNSEIKPGATRSESLELWGKTFSNAEVYLTGRHSSW